MKTLAKPKPRLESLAAASPASPRGAPLPQSAAVGLGAFVALAAVAGAGGGYFATSWGWAALLLGWVAALALLLRRGVWVGPLELACLAALAGLTAWTALSIAWSSDAPGSVLEVQRTLVYLLGLLAALVTVRRRHIPAFLGGIHAGIVVVSTAALLTRLFPTRGAGSDVILVNRLSEPIGYWNALGIFATMGALLALGLAAHGGARVVRAAAAASLPVVLVTLYFTYSRGAWIALGIGLIATLAIDPRRLRLVTVLIGLAPVSAVAVLMSANSDGLTRLRASHELITQEGRELALVLLLLVAASAAVSLVMSWGGDRLRVPPKVRLAYAAALALTLAVVLTGLFARFGDPVSLTGDAYRSFADQSPAPAPSPSATNDLNRRLFTLRGYGRVDFWEAARRENRERPLAGTGAGSFEQYWLEHRTFASQIRDAHSLYMETLGELGFVGLGLLVAVLAVPLVAGVAARAYPLVPGAFGASTAFAAHAAVDWDWEVPAVTLVALALSAVMLVACRGVRRAPLRLPFPARVGMVVALVAVGAFSAYGLVGNRALARAGDAADNARWREAEREARTAIRWVPWSGEAWQHLGNAQLGLGEFSNARTSLLKATRKDPGAWRIWFDLGTASSGRERRQAYARAAALNPLGEDIRTLRERGYRLPQPPKGER